MRPYNFGAIMGVFSRNFFRRRAATREAGVLICGYNFWNIRPLKFGRAKNVQILARFLTTFDFDRECFPNGSTFRKSKK